MEHDPFGKFSAGEGVTLLIGESEISLFDRVTALRGSPFDLEREENFSVTPKVENGSNKGVPQFVSVVLQHVLSGVGPQKGLHHCSGGSVGGYGADGNPVISFFAFEHIFIILCRNISGIGKGFPITGIIAFGIGVDGCAFPAVEHEREKLNGK